METGPRLKVSSHRLMKPGIEPGTPTHNFPDEYVGRYLILFTDLFLCFVFNIPPTAKVIWRQGHGLKSHPTDW